MPQKCYPDLHPLLLKCAERLTGSKAEQQALVERTIAAIGSDEEIFVRRAVGRSLYRQMLRIARKQEFAFGANRSKSIHNDSQSAQ
jgi:hypothetical protein